jgi:hypothetical protein
LGLRRSHSLREARLAMADRTATDIDVELSEAVKTRDAARRTISQASASVIACTSSIDRLLAERSLLTLVSNLVRS